VRALLMFALLAIGSKAQAQGLLGYVSGVPTGDALYVAVGNRIEAVRYIGIRRPDILHPTCGRELYEEVAREANRQLVGGKFGDPDSVARRKLITTRDRPMWRRRWEEPRVPVFWRQQGGAASCRRRRFGSKNRQHP